MIHPELVIMGLATFYIARRLWCYLATKKEEVNEEENQPEEAKGSEITKETELDGPYRN